MYNIKRTAKDSVFTALFSHKEYALQLFKALHPEEKNVTEKDIEIITIDNILTFDNERYQSELEKFNREVIGLNETGHASEAVVEWMLSKL